MLPPLLRKIGALQLSLVDVTTAAIRNSSAAFMARITGGDGLTGSAQTLSRLAKLESDIRNIVLSGSYTDDNGHTVTPITVVEGSGDDTVPGGLVIDIGDFDDGDNPLSLPSSQNSQGDIVTPMWLTDTKANFSLNTQVEMKLGKQVTTNFKDPQVIIPVEISNSGGGSQPNPNMVMELGNKL